jgi:vibriolysin
MKKFATIKISLTIIFAVVVTAAFSVSAAAVHLQIFSSTGNRSAHPTARVTVPYEYKIVGGGARVNWRGAGNLLISSYPETINTWVAMSKDHQTSSPATITVYAIAIYDPDDMWDVRIWTSTGRRAQHPIAQVSIDWNYTLTGGGARVNWEGAGSLLTASYPVDEITWEARSKDHLDSSPASITAYAIGIRHRTNGAPSMRIFSYTGQYEAHPTSKVSVRQGYTLTGGGAFNHWTGEGNLLTASYPDSGTSWVAAGKDHEKTSPSAIEVFAIGIR